MLMHIEVKRFSATRAYRSFASLLLIVSVLTCFDQVWAAAESVVPESKATLVVPADIQNKYPDFVKMITRTELLHVEEKQYWVDVLPEMTTEQRDNLTALLGTANDKMDALDEKYRNALSEMNKQVR
ncbi:MAG: hypothetical protein HXX17_07005 [Geobacteraceae bacterium]|nr:hypothetical protein [Geobacteraceae bacterium]